MYRWYILILVFSNDIEAGDLVQRVYVGSQYIFISPVLSLISLNSSNLSHITINSPRFSYHWPTLGVKCNSQLIYQHNSKNWSTHENQYHHRDNVQDSAGSTWGHCFFVYATQALWSEKHNLITAIKVCHWHLTCEICPFKPCNMYPSNVGDNVSSTWRFKIPSDYTTKSK